MRRGVNRDGSCRSKLLSLKVHLTCWRGLFLYLTQTSINKDNEELPDPEAWGREKLQEVLGLPWFLTWAHLFSCRQNSKYLVNLSICCFPNLNGIQRQYHNFACLISIAASSDWHSSCDFKPWLTSVQTYLCSQMFVRSPPSPAPIVPWPSLRSALCCLTGEMQLLGVCPCENRMSSVGSSAH